MPKSRDKYSLLEFKQYSFRVLLSRKAIHDLQLGELNINGIVILAEEDFDIILQDSRPPLNDQ